MRKFINILILAIALVGSVSAQSLDDLRKKGFTRVRVNGENRDLSEDIKLEDNTNILDLLVLSKIAPSKSEARRLVQGNGISINGEKVSDVNMIIDEKLFKDNSLVISKGKKTHIKVNLVK